MRIDHDLKCGRCGYNLRTLDAAAVCPECGLDAQASLAAADRPKPHGARRTLAASGWLAVSWCAVFLCVAAVIDLRALLLAPLAPALLLTACTAAFGLALWPVIHFLLRFHRLGPSITLTVAALVTCASWLVYHLSWSSPAESLLFWLVNTPGPVVVGLLICRFSNVPWFRRPDMPRPISPLAPPLWLMPWVVAVSLVSQVWLNMVVENAAQLVRYITIATTDLPAPSRWVLILTALASHGTSALFAGWVAGWAGRSSAAASVRITAGLYGGLMLTRLLLTWSQGYPATQVLISLIGLLCVELVLVGGGIALRHQTLERHEGMPASQTEPSHAD